MTDINPVHRGYDRENLQEAFDEVRCRDWRAPIYSKCHEDRRDIVEAAVEFFVGETPTIDRMDWRDEDYDQDYLRVESVGYRAGPCGP